MVSSLQDLLKLKDTRARDTMDPVYWRPTTAPSTSMVVVVGTGYLGHRTWSLGQDLSDPPLSTLNLKLQDLLLVGNG